MDFDVKTKVTVPDETIQEVIEEWIEDSEIWLDPDGCVSIWVEDVITCEGKSYLKQPLSKLIEKCNSVDLFSEKGGDYKPDVLIAELEKCIELLRGVTK